MIGSVGLGLLFTCACENGVVSPDEPDRFAIYIAADNETLYAPPYYPTVPLEPEPWLTDKDITSYEWDSHIITFPDSVRARLNGRRDLLHRYFVVTAGGERIYGGWFIDALDSTIPPVRIRIYCRHETEELPFPYVIRIGFAPSDPDYMSDPRPDPRIEQTLERAGKLLR